jgi:hypothetical protein
MRSAAASTKHGFHHIVLLFHASVVEIFKAVKQLYLEVKLIFLRYISGCNALLKSVEPFGNFECKQPEYLRKL